MCLSDLSALKSAIDPCNPRAGTLNQLSELCLAVESSVEFDFYQGAHTQAVADGATDVVTLSAGVNSDTGWLTGDTLVATKDNRVRLNIFVSLPTSTVAGTALLTVDVNGDTSTYAIEDDGVNLATFAQDVYVNTELGDVITISFESFAGSGGHSPTFSILAETV